MEFLNQQSDLMVCGQVFQASEVLAYIDHTQPDLIIQDLSTAIDIEIGKSVLASFPLIKLIALTRDQSLAQAAQQADFHGGIFYQAELSEIFQCIRSVLAGKNYFSIKPPVDTSLTLNSREKRVIALLRQGLKHHQIAEQLYIEPMTVRAYRHSIFHKLGVSKDADIVAYAIQNGIG
ncbi:response regulator transcription factor [Spirosoma harenae]